MTNPGEPIFVRSSDEKENKADEKKPGKEKKSDKQQEDISEEDRKLKADLDMLIERLQEPGLNLHKPALESMRSIIRTSTTSMTSVPKPLKFMMPHYKTMKHVHDQIQNPETKELCADIISVLAMCSDEQEDCVSYRMRGSPAEDIGQWGHEYVRHLCKGVIDDWRKTDEAEGDDRKSGLLRLVREIAMYNLRHNAEVEACDLLIEIDQLSLLLDDAFMAEVDCCRVCLYLLSCVPYLPAPDNQALIRCAMNIYLRLGKHFEALRSALMLNDLPLIRRIFSECPDRLVKKQMAILLGRHQTFLEIPDDDYLAELNANTHLHSHFLALARELDIMAPKTPEEIYKTHLEQSRPFQPTQTTDTARQNLAAFFVNGFVNCGFGTEGMLEKYGGGRTMSPSDWFQKSKEYAAFSAAASIGLIHRWDVDNGLSKCDPFLYGNDDYIRAGTLLAIGIIFSGIQDPVDPASALLLDKLRDDNMAIRIGSTLGLGLAYANSKRNTVVGEGGVVSELQSVISEELGNRSSVAMIEVKGLAALSLGLILVGTANSEVAQELFAQLMEHTTDQHGGGTNPSGTASATSADQQSASNSYFSNPNARLIALGIALIYLGTQENSEVMVDAVKALPEPFGTMTSILIDVCAYAGTGNVLKIQNLLHICSEHYEPVTADNKKDDKNKDAKKKGPLDITGTTATSGSAASTAGASRVPPGIGGSVTAGAAVGTGAIGGQTSSVAASKQKQPDTAATKQSIAALGIGLVAMGEPVGSQMALRMFGHLTRYGEPAIRHAVPLALALLSVSNPQLTIMETLAKHSRDSDISTARNAIFALGLVGAGTNNARLVALLRQLASYHTKDQITMMLVRITQGLVHLGKGTMTLNPFHSDRQLLCPAAVGALFAVCFAFLDAEHTVLSNRQHYLLYTLVVAIQPRMMITLVEEGDDEASSLSEGDGPHKSEDAMNVDEAEEHRLIQKPVQVRVGQAVDVVAQAGQPRAITGFQTHTTPVLLTYDERAELADDDYESLTPILEGLVILRKKKERPESGGSTLRS